MNPDIVVRNPTGRYLTMHGWQVFGSGTIHFPDPDSAKRFVANTGLKNTPDLEYVPAPNVAGKGEPPYADLPGVRRV